MDTLALLQCIAYGSPPERTQALEAAGSSEYQSLLKILAEESDDKVVFWCLELLLKEQSSQLQPDADNLIPLILARLTWESGIVFDRANRILNGLGKKSVEALLSTIAAAPDIQTAVACTGALRSNPSLHLMAEQTLDLLGQQLDSPNEEVRYWTMIVLMDIGPLRSRFDARMPRAAFELLYSKLLVVAREFAASRPSEMGSQYVELLTQHLTTNRNYRSRP